MQRVSAGVIYKEYQIAADTTHSTPHQLDFPSGSTGRQRLILEAVSQRITFKFGSANTVEADRTVTGNEQVDGNFSVASGAIIEVEVDAFNDWVSVEAPGAGTAIIKLANAGL